MALPGSRRRDQAAFQRALEVNQPYELRWRNPEVYCDCGYALEAIEENGATDRAGWQRCG